MEEYESEEAGRELQDEQDGTKVIIGNTTQQIPSLQHCINLLKQVEHHFIVSIGEMPNSLIILQSELLRLPETQSKITDFFRKDLVNGLTNFDSICCIFVLR